MTGAEGTRTLNTRCINERTYFPEIPPLLVHLAPEGPLGWASLRAARSLSLPVATSYPPHSAPSPSAYRLGMRLRERATPTEEHGAIDIAPLCNPEGSAECSD